MQNNRTKNLFENEKLKIELIRNILEILKNEFHNKKWVSSKEIIKHKLFKKDLFKNEFKQEINPYILSHFIKYFENFIERRIKNGTVKNLEYCIKNPEIKF